MFQEIGVQTDMDKAAEEFHHLSKEEIEVRLSEVIQRNETLINNLQALKKEKEIEKESVVNTGYDGTTLKDPPLYEANKETAEFFQGERLEFGEDIDEEFLERERERKKKGESGGMGWLGWFCAGAAVAGFGVTLYHKSSHFSFYNPQLNVTHGKKWIKKRFLRCAQKRKV